MPPKKDALATIDGNAFPIIAADSAADALDVVQHNMGDSGLKISDLDRVTVPTGGGTSFTIPTLEGGEESVDSIVGIIALAPEQKAYWDSSFEDNPNQPPACFSSDTRTGQGNNGDGDGMHQCATCQQNQWGSAAKGTGKACKDMCQLAIILPDAFLPTIVAAPRTSLKAKRAYFAKLANKGIPYDGAITKITLTPTKNEAGVKYSELSFALVAILNKEQRQQIRTYAAALAPHMSQPPTVTAAPASDPGDYDPFAAENQQDQPPTDAPPFAEAT